MNTYIATTAIALGLATSSVAEPFLPTRLDYSHQDYASYSGQWSFLTCDDIVKAATQIAAIRQTTDKPLETALSEIMGTKTATAPVKRVIMQITRDAYSYPSLGEHDNEGAIAAFTSAISTQCNSRSGY